MIDINSTGNYPNGTGENTWSALTIPELREILKDPNSSEEEIKTVVSKLNKEAKEKGWNKHHTMVELFAIIAGEDQEGVRRFLQYKEMQRREDLKGNQNKRPLYDEDGNKMEVSNEKVKFLEMASNIEKHCIQKGIDTIYFIGKVNYIEANKGQSSFNGLFEYKGFCEKPDGKMYYAERPSNERMEYYEDAKRFRRNRFPNMNVEFLEGELHTERVPNGAKQRITCDFPKTKGALLIGENYRDKSIFEKFKLYCGECIEYHSVYEPKFIAGKGIENFS